MLKVVTNPKYAVKYRASSRTRENETAEEMEARVTLRAKACEVKTILTQRDKSPRRPERAEIPLLSSEPFWTRLDYFLRLYEPIYQVRVRAASKCWLAGSALSSDMRFRQFMNKLDCRAYAFGSLLYDAKNCEDDIRNVFERLNEDTGVHERVFRDDYLELLRQRFRDRFQECAFQNDFAIAAFVMSPRFLALGESTRHLYVPKATAERAILRVSAYFVRGRNLRYMDDSTADGRETFQCESDDEDTGIPHEIWDVCVKHFYSREGLSNAARDQAKLVLGYVEQKSARTKRAETRDYQHNRAASVSVAQLPAFAAAHNRTAEESESASMSPPATPFHAAQPPAHEQFDAAPAATPAAAAAATTAGEPPVSVRLDGSDVVFGKVGQCKTELDWWLGEIFTAQLRGLADRPPAGSRAEADLTDLTRQLETFREFGVWLSCFQATSAGAERGWSRVNRLFNVHRARSSLAYINTMLQVQNELFADVARAIIRHQSSLLKISPSVGKLRSDEEYYDMMYNRELREFNQKLVETMEIHLKALKKERDDGALSDGSVEVEGA